jgi:hypothetical protein
VYLDWFAGEKLVLGLVGDLKEKDLIILVRLGEGVGFLLVEIEKELQSLRLLVVPR